ncbi:MAG: hypothetical protein KBD01_14360 [Acidobacteria bacterium]|nr:hypothetical protein [Acidobacteriota bacterium]
MTPIDAAYRRTQEGSQSGFTSWVQLCEASLRSSLRSFARAVDVEAVLQECLLRMWTLARELDLDDRENASMRVAIRMARNLALDELRRSSRTERIEDLGEELVDVTPRWPDPGLRGLIQQCFERLPGKPRQALLARISGRADRDLARELRMQVNTFVQNVARARRALAECLERQGVRLQEHLR